MSEQFIEIRIDGPPDHAVAAKASLLPLLKAVPGLRIERRLRDGASDNNTLADPMTVLTVVLASPVIVELAKAIHTWAKNLSVGRRQTLKLTIGPDGAVNLETQNMEKDIHEMVLKAVNDALLQKSKT